MNDEIKVEEIPRENTSTGVISTPMKLLELAVSKDADVDRLGKLMELQFKWEANQAYKAYIEAMSEFQSKCPIIKKTKAGGTTRAREVAYYYAPLDEIVSQVKDLIKECGFSYYIQTRTNEKDVEVDCIIRHKDGHSETSHITLPIVDKTNIMSAPQVIASTMTYGKRNAFCNGFGIITGDNDDDAVSSDMLLLFEDMVKGWSYTDHIRMKANSIKSALVFKKFLEDMPSAEYVNKFKALLDKLNVDEDKIPAYRAKLWNDFQKLHKDNVEQWLTNLSISKIIKKEVQNG